MSDLIRSTSFRTGPADGEPNAGAAPTSSAHALAEAQVSALQGARQSTQTPGADIPAALDDKRVSARVVSEAAPEQQQRLDLTRRLSEIIVLAESLQADHTPPSDSAARLRKAVNEFVEVGGKALSSEQGRAATFEVLLGQFQSLRDLRLLGTEGDEPPLFESLAVPLVHKCLSQAPGQVPALVAHLAKAEACTAPSRQGDLTDRFLSHLTKAVLTLADTTGLAQLLEHALRLPPLGGTHPRSAIFGTLEMYVMHTNDTEVILNVADPLGPMMSRFKPKEVGSIASSVLDLAKDVNNFPRLLDSLTRGLGEEQSVELGRCLGRWALDHLAWAWSDPRCLPFLSSLKTYFYQSANVTSAAIAAMAYGLVSQQQKFGGEDSLLEAYASAPIQDDALDTTGETIANIDAIDLFGQAGRLTAAMASRDLAQVLVELGLGTEEHLWVIDKSVREGKVPKDYLMGHAFDVAGPELAPKIRLMGMTPEAVFGEALADVARGFNGSDSKSESKYLEARLPQNLLEATEKIDFAVECVVRRNGLAAITQLVESGALENLRPHEPQLREHRAALQKHIEAVKVQAPAPQAAPPELVARWRELCIAPLQAYVDMIDRIIGADLPETKSTSS